MISDRFKVEGYEELDKEIGVLRAKSESTLGHLMELVFDIKMTIGVLDSAQEELRKAISKKQEIALLKEKLAVLEAEEERKKQAEKDRIHNLPTYSKSGMFHIARIETLMKEHFSCRV